ncbi:MAG: YdeI/OmpD-associated family protein [Chitinophagaceae bacterium]|jgi:uncharacterized protein YdeI (YjbR/CyaY-like superfamily)|nr:YdeI/OmpD-associated family protein [Chitinophagaceae bacterium]
MPQTDTRVDTYIAKSASFAQPILVHLRSLIHKSCPNVMETIKWGMPNFDYKGKILCNFAAFKQHCAFNFWLGSVMQTVKEFSVSADREEAMGDLGKIKSLSDLPPDKLFLKALKEAQDLIDKGVTLPKKQKDDAPKEISVPDYFVKALKKNKQAADVFNKFSYSCKKEYVDWITEAKTDATREKRIATAIEWLAEGKSRMWKYEKK